MTKTVDTVNHIRESNTNLEPIYIALDDRQIFALPTLTYRERLALTSKLLLAMLDHPSTAKHQRASAESVIRQINHDSLTNLGKERAEDERIARELKEAGLAG